MPHDANGVPLQVGDRVVIYGTITQITSATDYCNCTVELETPMPPDGTKTTIYAINTKQLMMAIGSTG